jgi:TldD protein
VKTPFADISSETKLNWLFELDKTLTSSFNGNIFPFRLFILSLETNKKFIGTNEGTQVESDYSLGRYTSILTAKGEKDTEQRWMSRGATGGWEYFADPKFIESFIEEAQDAKTVADKAKAMTFDKPIDFIVGPEVSGIIAHENCGHPSEADRIQGREGMNAGESFWMDIDIGTTRVGSPAVTVIDDPTMPKNGGFYLYDDEGVKARPRYLIKEGIAHEIFHDRLSAGRAGVKSNGSSRATNYDREPIPRMANTYIAPGDHSKDELIEDIKFGIYMKNFTEWNIDDRRYQSKYVGSYARLIRDGEITDEFVRRPVLELTSRGLFNAVDACSKGFTPDQAICGKSDPGQGIPVWHAGPDAMRLRSIRVGGVPT